MLKGHGVDSNFKLIIELAGFVIFTGVGIIGSSWLKILKETNALLKEQNDELKADNKEWQKKHVENERAIANLQGQLDTLKDIPLQQIAASLESISNSNAKILSALVRETI